LYGVFLSDSPPLDVRLTALKVRHCGVMLEEIRVILAAALQLGDRAADFTAETPLLGSLPELDSFAVVTLITALEEHYDLVVDDDEVSADTFATLGTLTAFIEGKCDA